MFFYYLNLLYISVVLNSADKVKGIRKQAMEHTDKSAVSFKMRVFYNNQQTQIQVTRVRKEEKKKQNK